VCVSVYVCNKGEPGVVEGSTGDMVCSTYCHFLHSKPKKIVEINFSIDEVLDFIDYRTNYARARAHF